MIDQSGPNAFPLNNAYGAVVMGADTSSVRFVMVSGVVKKWGDTLVGADVAAVRSTVEDSRAYLLEQVGYEPTSSSTTRPWIRGRHSIGPDQRLEAGRNFEHLLIGIRTRRSGRRVASLPWTHRTGRRRRGTRTGRSPSRGAMVS